MLLQSNEDPPLGSSPVSTLAYTDLECDKQLLSADQIISRWDFDRHQLARNVDSSKLANPWKNVVPQDYLCKCHLGKEHKSYEDGSCAGCAVGSRLFHREMMKLEEPFTIQAGSYKDHKMIIYSQSGHLAGYTVDKYAKQSAIDVLGHLSNLDLCTPSLNKNVNDMTFWACKGSPQEHYILVSAFLQNELHKNGLPYELSFRWVFQCRDTFNIVESIHPLGTGTLKELVKNGEYLEMPRSPTARSSPTVPFNTKVIRGIIFQLAATLKAYGEYILTHGDASIYNLAFCKTPISYEYAGLKVESPLTLYVIPSNNTSLSTIDNKDQLIRIFHPGSKLHQVIDIKMLPQIEVMPILGAKEIETCLPTDDLTEFQNPCTEEYLQNEIMTYKLNPTSYQAYVRNLGIPLFEGSYDLYAFWAGLMCEDVFYTGIKKDKQLMDVWQDLFDYKEYEDMMNDLKLLRQRPANEISPTSDELLEVLSKYHLRCDALNHVWNQLVKI